MLWFSGSQWLPEISWQQDGKQKTNVSFPKWRTVPLTGIVWTLCFFIPSHQSQKSNASPPHYRSFTPTSQACDHIFAQVDLNVQNPSMNIYETCSRQRRVIIRAWKLISCRFFFAFVSLNESRSRSVNQTHCTVGTTSLHALPFWKLLAPNTKQCPQWPQHALVAGIQINRRRTTSYLATAMVQGWS